MKVLCQVSLAISEVVSLALSETFFGRLPRKGFGLMRARARVCVCVKGVICSGVCVVVLRHPRQLLTGSADFAQTKK